jgi:hypothetical protein
VIKIGFPITKIAQIFFGDSWVLWATFLLMKTGWYIFFGRRIFLPKNNLF